MQNTQANAASVPHQRPTKPDFSNVFLEPLYAETIPLEEADTDEIDPLL